MSRWHPLSRRSAALLLGLLVFGPALGAWTDTARAAGPRRVALIVGNAEYRSSHFADLPNAARDAAALSRRLAVLGFKVLAAENATEAAFHALLAEAAAERPTEALLFFFGGHAVVANGETLLLPVDMPDPNSIGELAEHGVRLHDVAAAMADTGRPAILFLDACLDAPLETGATAPDLSEPKLPEAGNVFLGFAAQPGHPAADGTIHGSPFARALIGAIALPGGLGVLMERVRAETARLTFGRQLPWSRSTLYRDFFFVTAREDAVRPDG